MGIKDYILYGRRFVKAKKDKERIKALKRVIAINSVMSSLTFIFLLFINFYLVTVLQPFMLSDSNNKKLLLDTSELNETEKLNVEKILEDLKPIYLKGQKSIKFTKNITTPSGEHKEGLLGYNAGRKVNVLYVEDILKLKGTICHELLHSYINFGNIPHAIIYDLEDYFVCYKSTRVREWQE